VPNSRLRFILPLGLFVALLAVSTASIFIRFAQREAPSLVIAAFRLTIASLALAPLALTRHRRELTSLSRRDILLASLAGVSLALHFATWISSLEYTSIASSVVLVTTSPLWVALLTPLVLHEKLAKVTLVGMALALTGGTIIAMGDACSFANDLSCPPFSEFVRGRAMWGNFLSLAGAWAVTGYLLIGRSLRARLPLTPYIFIVYSAAALALIIIMIAAGKSPFGYQPITYLWMALLAIVPQLIGHSTYNWALHYLPAALVAVVSLGEPVGTSILAYLILHEIPGRLTLLGGALILGGIYVASQRKP
jgi:drug/metabolite transporter (DMT)-like permease